jgi:hypothetical protein
MVPLLPWSAGGKGPFPDLQYVHAHFAHVALMKP